MQNTLSRYTGAHPMAPFWRAGPVPQGHCRHCGEASGGCRCGCRECRREAKELLVTPQSGQLAPGQSPIAGGLADNRGALEGSTTAQGFIGGGCCVSLSVEYAPQSPTAAFRVEVAVQDSEGTEMLWRRSEPAGTGYRIKEAVITTKPGAQLLVLANNCTARVRWCEIFSC